MNDSPSSFKGGLVVISGPSGSGKTTLCREILKDPRITVSVSVTTRSPRPGEIDGKAYHFMGREDFEAAMARDEFVEWAEVYGNLYGSLKAPMIQAMSWKDRYYAMEIDVQGALQLQDQGFLGTYILVVPPSLEELRRRLESRGTESEEVIVRRLSAAAAEMAQSHRYDHVIVNDELPRAIEEARSILGLCSGA